MGETVIESLIIKLGLDAKGLNEGKAIDAVNNIKNAVESLNNELIGTEDMLKSLSSQFGGFGKAARSKSAPKPTAATPVAAAPAAPTAATPVAAAPAAPTKAEAKKKREDDALFDFIEKSKASEKQKQKVISGMDAEQAKRHLASLEGSLSAEQEKQYRPEDTLGQAKGKEKTDSLTRLIPFTKKHLEVAQREEAANKKERRHPHSIGGMLMGSGGMLGPLAAGLYLAKNIVGAISGAIKGIIEFSKESIQLQQTAKSIGLGTGGVAAIRDMAITFGDTTGAIMADLAKFGDEFVSDIPGQFNYGLKLMNIAVVDGKGKARKYSDVLNELSDSMAKLPKNDTDVYRYYRQVFGFSKQFVDMMQLGSKGMEQYRKEMVAQGYAKPQFEVEREAKIGEAASLEWQRVLIGMNEALYGLLLGFEEIGFLFSHPLDFMKSLGGNLEKNTLDWATNPMYDKTVSKGSVSVSPNVNAVATGLRTGGADATSIDKMTINVSVDKNGSAKASVNGVNPRRLDATLSPYRTAQ